MKQQKIKPKQNQRGQSLVEVALFFPIFVILLAGLVEVSQLLITQNRISSAARAGTRFASNGGEDAGIVTVMLNNITQTLQTDEDVWDVWSIHATINDAGDGIDPGEWEFNHIYGISNTVRAPSVNEDAIRQQIIDELQRDEFVNTTAGIANGLKIVGTYAIHDVDSILGLDAMSQLAGFSSLNALSIMRITADGQVITDGCSAFPLIISDGERSLTSAQYPNNGDFTYPVSNQPIFASFTNNRPDIPILNASEGYLFKFDVGEFDWLVWNEGLAANATNLANSLSWPGDSTNYTACPTCGTAVPGSGYTTAVRGYIEPGDPTDQTLHEGDFVSTSGGGLSDAAVASAIQEHISLDRALRVAVWGETVPQYRINQDNGFAIIRIIGYNANSNWILAEFIRWDDSCGQVN